MLWYINALAQEVPNEINQRSFKEVLINNENLVLLEQTYTLRAIETKLLIFETKPL